MAAKKVLSEALEDLSSEELQEFKSLIKLEKGFPVFSSRKLKVASRQDLVEVMVATYGQECVDLTREVFEKMNIDVAQGLLDMSPGTKEKQQPSLIERVEMTASLVELLLETLQSLSDGELEKFKEALTRLREPSSDAPWLQLTATDMQDLVFLMVLTLGRHSKEATEKVLKKIKRTDLVQKLSGPKHKRQAVLIQQVVTMAAVLSHKELQDDSASQSHREEMCAMVQTHGRRSVELTRRVSMEMKSTDPVRRLSKQSSEKDCVDERPPALIHKVATMSAVKELLLETLDDLSREERKNFRWLLHFRFFQRSLPHVSRLHVACAERLVNLLVDACGQQSMEVAAQVYTDMNRTDLVLKLSETGPGPQEEQPLEQHWPALVKNVEPMASVIELLLETLEDLTDGELEKFKEILVSRTFFDRPPMDASDVQDIVFTIVQIYGLQSVETTGRVLKRMNRTDLVDRMSKSSSGAGRKPADKRQAVLIQRVATMAAVLSHKELQDDSASQSHREEMCAMVQTHGRRSVELTRRVSMEMKRTDPVRRLSKQSSERHSVDECRPAPLEAAAVKQMLSETLGDLSLAEFKKFRWLLQFTYFQRSLPQISWSLLDWTGRTGPLVEQMLQQQQAVEVTRQVLMELQRADLVPRLSGNRSGLKENHHRNRLQKKINRKSVQRKLLEALEDLSSADFTRFKRVLLQVGARKGQAMIPRSQVKMADRVKLVELMVEVHGQQCVEVIRQVLKKMKRRSLVQSLSDSRRCSSRCSGLCIRKSDCCLQPDSSDWTGLEPEVSGAGAEEASTHSLQSEAGRFECSVSGLRWVCKGQVAFKYQFCSWEEPMDRMESRGYMPAGPLIDITIITGKLDEVYLPHWICLHDDPKVSDKFAVLHIEDCGDVVEKVSEVTASHIKLSEPVFSPRAALMKAGFRVKISCNVLIYYKPNTSFLKLHVYLIPNDPHLQQTMNKKKSSEGFRVILKPRPDKYLKMQQGFILTADVDTANISPEKITLRYDSEDPNFYEVFIENPDRNFHLMLSTSNKDEPCCEPVWQCEIRNDDYRHAHLEERDSVEQLSALMRTATITTDREMILQTLENLTQDEFNKFKWCLRNTEVLEGFQRIPRSRLENRDVLEVVDLLFHLYNQQSVEATRRVLIKINRNDLVQSLKHQEFHF